MTHVQEFKSVKISFFCPHIWILCFWTRFTDHSSFVIKSLQMGSLVLAYILFLCKYLFFLSECCIFSILGVWRFKWRIAISVCSNKFYLGIGEHLLIETVSPQLRKIFLYSYVNINFSSSSVFLPLTLIFHVIKSQARSIPIYLYLLFPCILFSILVFPFLLPKFQFSSRPSLLCVSCPLWNF